MNEKELREKLTKQLQSADGKLLKMLDALVTAYSETEEIAPIEEPEQLYRMVYTSARSTKCNDDCVEDILRKARKNNAALNVTGLLIHTKDRFLQILEGSEKNVQFLYDKIQLDDRHGGSSVRFFEPVAKREFGEWNMAYKKVTDQSIEYNTDTSTENKNMYKSLMDGNLFSYKDDGMRILKTFLLVS
jgi:hypothetical protein